MEASFPDDAPPSGRRDFRARLMATAFASAVGASALFAVLNAVVGDPAWLVDLAGAVLLAGVWAQRARMSHGRLALIFSLVATVITAAAIVPTGPRLEYYLWFFPIPPIAAVLGGRRLATWMFALDAALIVGFEVAVAAEWMPRPPPSAPWFQLAILLGVFAVMGAFAGAYDRSRERAQARLQAARRRAEAADLAKSRFLAAMTHELRTPMNGILGMTEEMLRHPLSDTLREMLQTVQGSGGAMVRLIDDLLDHSRIEAGKVQIEALPFSPRRVVDEVVALLGPRARDAGLTLRSEVAMELPPLLLGDAFRLRQVLLNLIGNAIKFTRAGSVEVRIDRLVEGRYRFEVRDTGVGISAAALRGLFERYSQADASTARVYGGSGLGLAISRGLVEAMGGTLSATSELGSGSTFTAEIPLPVAEALTPAPIPLLAPAPMAPRPDRRARTVIIADDDHVSRRIASLFLERSGYTCRLVSDGRAALEVLRSEPVHAVLLDCRMPILDGPSTARAIRDLPSYKRRVPIIALTATKEEEGSMCLESGMDAVLGKPTTMDELVAEVDRWTASTLTPVPSSA